MLTDQCSIVWRWESHMRHYDHNNDGINYLVNIIIKSFLDISHSRVKHIYLISATMRSHEVMKPVRTPACFIKISRFGAIGSDISMY